MCQQCIYATIALADAVESEKPNDSHSLFRQYQCVLHEHRRRPSRYLPWQTILEASCALACSAARVRGSPHSLCIRPTGSATWSKDSHIGRESRSRSSLRLTRDRAGHVGIRRLSRRDSTQSDSNQYTKQELHVRRAEGERQSVRDLVNSFIERASKAINATHFLELFQRLRAGGASCSSLSS